MNITASQAAQVAHVAKITGCTEVEALVELIAEEWNTADAIKNLREMVRAFEEHDAEQWADEMAQLSFAERGGYAAGLSRPASRFERVRGVIPAAPTEEFDDIPY